MTPDAWAGAWGKSWGNAWGMVDAEAPPPSAQQPPPFGTRRRTRGRRLLPLVAPSQAVAIDQDDEDLALHLLGMM